MKSTRLTIEEYRTDHATLISAFQCDELACGNSKHFQDYLRYNALSDAQTGMGVTHVLCEYADDVPVKLWGYVSMKATSVISEEENGHSGKPAIEISELAVDKTVSRRGVGTELIHYALATINLIRKQIGVRFVTVYADAMAVGFYEKVGFTKLSTLYDLPTEDWNADCIPMCILISP